MTRRVRDSNLETRNARRALKTQSKPYWRAMDSGLHLGYRKRLTGGTWIARRLKDDGTYTETKLALADDYQDADTIKTLDYPQALDAARSWYHEAVRIDAGQEDEVEAGYTVKSAMADYLIHYAREGKALGPTTASVNAHILPALGDVSVAKLTPKKITAWHSNLALTPARKRTAKAAPEQNFNTITANDPDAIRKRRATANRVLTIFRAALNLAWRTGKVPDDSAWRKVKSFRNVSSPVIRYLKADECTRLINACESDLRSIVQGALLTGCRYGELARLKVGDFNSDAGSIVIRASKGGKARHVTLSAEGINFFIQIIVGKEIDKPIFTHGDGALWGKSHQQRPLKEACSAANIKPAIGFHILRHTYASFLAMAGVSMQVIAQQLGHADTRMTEKHYAHLAPSYVVDRIRQSFPLLGIVSATNVQSLPTRRHGNAHRA